MRLAASEDLVACFFLGDLVEVGVDLEGRDGIQGAWPPKPNDDCSSPNAAE